jgi:hypothetical protein
LTSFGPKNYPEVETVLLFGPKNYPEVETVLLFGPTKLSKTWGSYTLVPKVSAKLKLQ